MKIKEIDGDSQYLDSIKQIYLYSFPASERIEFKDLLNCTFPNSKLLGILNEDVLIGFAFISLFEDFVYIVYLAIDETQRNKSFGTKALNELKNLYKDKTRVLCVEKPHSKDDIQARRIGFYRRNGFSLADFEFELEGQSFYSMYSGKFDKKKFIDLLLTCFPGCKNFNVIKG